MTVWDVFKSAMFYLLVAVIVVFSIFPFYNSNLTYFATGTELFSVR